MLRARRKLIAILIAQRVRKGGFQLSGMARKMNIGKTFERFGDFSLRFRVQERAPAARHQELGQRQFCRCGLRAVDGRLRRYIREHQRFGLRQQIT
jgi:hypothetical protein